MDNQSDHFLKISGKVNIPVPLDVDTDYQFTGLISTYGADSTSKQDGTHTITHKAEFVGEISLIKGEQVILGKDKQSNSQRLRKAVFARGHDYAKFMFWLFRRLDELFEEYEIDEARGVEGSTISSPDMR